MSLARTMPMTPALAEPRPGVNAPEIPEHPRPTPETPGSAEETPELPRPRRARPEMPGRHEESPEAPESPNQPAS